MSTDLTVWYRANPPRPEMYAAKAAERQMLFLRDTLIRAFFDGRVQADARTRVISQHQSKSVPLPVVEYTPAGARVIVRGNFYNWKVSVDSSCPLTMDYPRLFAPDADISPVYCEGFPEKDVFGPYASGAKQFTTTLYDEHALWTFCYLLRLALEDAGGG
jgi:hypothetical protein